MKKSLLTATFMLLGIATLFAQVELKASVGTNFSSFSNTPNGSSYSGKAGYQFGGGVLIGEKFYVEPGIQFVKSTGEITENSTSFDFSQNFVKIPVYAGYHLLGAEDKPIALRIFAGPTVSIAGKISKGEDQIGKDDLKKAIWAVDGGLGLDIFFLFVEANYEYAFTDHFVSDANNAKHGAFIINAGVHIDF
jgi:hypothetical protein